MNKPGKSKGLLAAGVILAAAASLNAQPFVAFGLTNVPLGNATSHIAFGQVQLSNLRTNGADGISIHLGQADSGVFVYPLTTSDTMTGSFMTGHLYGSVNGETNRLICLMRAHEEMDGHHPVQIDLSPLGPSHVTFHLFRHGEPMGQTGPQQGSMVVFGNYFNPYYPRVNPFWRLRDGSVGALIQFDRPAQMNLPELCLVEADWVFVRAENPTNVVDFATRLDVAGGGGLEWFSFHDTSLGVFRRSHRALSDSLLQAQTNRLTLSHHGTNAVGAGVAIELEMASRFQLTLEPVQLNESETFSITGVGVSGASNETLGVLKAIGLDDRIEILAQLDIAPTNAEVIVYRDGVEVARAFGTNAFLPSHARLVGCSFHTRTAEEQPGLGLRTDQVLSFTLPNQVAAEGNEIRFVGASPAVLFALQSVAVETTGISSFTITKEEEQQIAPPRLDIVRVGNQIELSWLDPGRGFGLETASALGHRFESVGPLPVYQGDRAAVTLYLNPGISGDLANRFYRLTSIPAPEQDPEGRSLRRQPALTTLADHLP